MRKKSVPITRRSFLRSGVGLGGVALGSGASGLLQVGCTADPPVAPSVSTLPSVEQYGPFRMGFQSYSLRHFTERGAFLREASRLGLPYVELYRGHLATDSSAEEIEAMKMGLASVGLTANAFGVERYTADHDKNEALFKFGRALGVTTLTASPDKDAFSSLEKLVDQYDIRIAIHNHGPEDERWRLPEWILEAVKNLDPRIGACADLGHFIRAGVGPVEAIETLGSRVLGVHLKDFDEDLKDAILGEGQMDVVQTLAALKKVGFEGPLSLEYEADKEDPIPAMLRCLEIVREAVKQI